MKELESEPAAGQDVPEGAAVALVVKSEPLEADRRASDLRLRALMENASEAIWLIGPDGRVRYATANTLRIIGYDAERLVGTLATDWILQEDRDHVNTETQALVQEPTKSRVMSCRIRRPNGDVRWMECTGSLLLEGPDAGLLVSNFRDVTDRKEAEAQLLRGQRLLEEAEAVAALGSWSAQTADGPITWSAECARLFDRPRSPAPCANDLVQWIHAEDRPRVIAAIQRAHAEGTVLEQDHRIVLSDGSVRWVHMRNKVAGAIRFEGDVGHVEGDGRMQIVGTYQDITARKEAEQELLASEHALRRTEEQLQHSQKMEAVGSLAGGVAHDFNNLLSVILSYCSLVLDDLPEGSPLRADVQQIEAAGHRATALTRQLLAFSRRQILQPCVLDLNQVVDDVGKMLKRLLGDDVELAFVSRAERASILADRGQLEQILMNLLVNARDAMPRGGSVTIACANVQLGAEQLFAAGPAKPGAYVLLAVTDTGTGMDAATRARVFEPFFTTKDQGKGTGLGLSTVYGIVQQSRGHIEVESEPGAGTTFKVYLPCSAHLPTVAPLASPPRNVRGTETILLVEDEEQVRVTTRTILRKQGYTVLEAQNGSDGLRIAEAFDGPIDLLLTDVIMPKMSGPAMVERFVQVRPRTKILFVSGYTDNAIAQHGVLEVGVNLLMKPVVPAALLAKVRSLLDEERPIPHPE